MPSGDLAKLRVASGDRDKGDGLSREPARRMRAEETFEVLNKTK